MTKLQRKINHKPWKYRRQEPPKMNRTKRDAKNVQNARGSAPGTHPLRQKTALTNMKRFDAWRILMVFAAMLRRAKR